jgi:Raf kinase inhibitor-like YbhB/YbcL family protein
MNSRWMLIVLAIAAGIALAEATAIRVPSNGAFQLTSSAFQDGGTIPDQYTCVGKNVSPPLQWSGVPESTKSLVLIVEDPDAPSGVWTHWAVYDLPPNAARLPEGISSADTVPGGGRQGLNDFKSIGYGGPCPPPGSPHHYRFKLFALDSMLGLKAGATKDDVELTMKKHVIGQAQLTAVFGRQ